MLTGKKPKIIKTFNPLLKANKLKEFVELTIASKNALNDA